MSNNDDFDFDELELDAPIVKKPKEVVEEVKEIKQDIEEEDEEDEGEFPDIELNDKDIASIEAKAVADEPDLNNLDAYIEKFKEPTKAEIAKAAKMGNPPIVEPKKPAPPKVVWKGPRLVKVYGDEMFTELDDNVTLEEIREKLVDIYKFAEFSKDRTYMSIDETTGIVVPAIRFEKKG